MLQARPHLDGDVVVLNGDNVFVDGIGGLLDVGADHDGERVNVNSRADVERAEALLSG